MGLLTTTESQSLWDNRTKGRSCKCYNSATKDASSFIQYLFNSTLEGVTYQVNSVMNEVSVTHSSTAAIIETNIKAYLETLDKIAAPTETSTDI